MHLEVPYPSVIINQLRTISQDTNRTQNLSPITPIQTRNFGRHLNHTKLRFLPHHPHPVNIPFLTFYLLDHCPWMEQSSAVACPGIPLFSEWISCCTKSGRSKGPARRTCCSGTYSPSSTPVFSDTLSAYPIPVHSVQTSVCIISTSTGQAIERLAWWMYNTILDRYNLVIHNIFILFGEAHRIVSYIMNAGDRNANGSSLPGLSLFSPQPVIQKTTKKTYSRGPRTRKPRTCVSFPLMWFAATMI